MPCLEMERRRLFIFKRCPGLDLPGWPPNCCHLPHLLSDGHWEGALLCQVAKVDLQRPCAFMMVAWRGTDFFRRYPSPSHRRMEHLAQGGLILCC